MGALVKQTRCSARSNVDGLKLLDALNRSDPQFVHTCRIIFIFSYKSKDGIPILSTAVGRVLVPALFGCVLFVVYSVRVGCCVRARLSWCALA